MTLFIWFASDILIEKELLSLIDSMTVVLMEENDIIF